MKKLTDKSIEDMVNIILPYPATRVMQISDGEEKFADEIKLTQRLFSLIQEREYDFQLNLINSDKVDVYKEQFINEGVSSSVRPLHPKQPRYGMQGKFYDYLYVTAQIEEAMQEEFVKKVYEVIKSGGLILAFINKDIESYDRWFNLLQDNSFVAINSIDICEDFHVMSARKMHGWGG